MQICEITSIINIILDLKREVLNSNIIEVIAEINDKSPNINNWILPLLFKYIWTIGWRHGKIENLIKLYDIEYLILKVLTRKYLLRFEWRY